MNKTEQYIKELQMLIGNEEMNEIINEKMMNMWRDARSEASNDYVRSWKQFSEWQKAGLSESEKERMNKSHRWNTDDREETSCYKCGLDERSMYECPQYCEPRENVAK